MPGTNFSPGLAIRSFNWMVLMSRFVLLTSRCVAKSRLGGLGNHLSMHGVAAGHDHAQRIAKLHAVGLCLGQRRIDPGLRQVHDGDNGRACGHHFALPRGPHVHLAVDRRHTPAHSPLLREPPAPVRAYWLQRHAIHPQCGRKPGPAIRAPALAATMPPRLPRCPWPYLQRPRRPAELVSASSLAWALIIPCLASATVRVVSAR